MCQMKTNCSPQASDASPQNGPHMSSITGQLILYLSCAVGNTSGGCWPPESGRLAGTLVELCPNQTVHHSLR